MIHLMICRIRGILEAVEGDTALIRPEGGVTYEVLVPAYARLHDYIANEYMPPSFRAWRVSRRGKIATSMNCLSRSRGSGIAERCAR